MVLNLREQTIKIIDKLTFTAEQDISVRHTETRIQRDTRYTPLQTIQWNLVSINCVSQSINFLARWRTLHLITTLKLHMHTKHFQTFQTEKKKESDWQAQTGQEEEKESPWYRVVSRSLNSAWWCVYGYTCLFVISSYSDSAVQFGIWHSDSMK